MASASLLAMTVGGSPAATGAETDVTCDVPGQMTAGAGGWTSIKAPDFPNSRVDGSEPQVHIPTAPYVVDPENPNLILMVGRFSALNEQEQVVYRSDDGGCHWEEVPVALDFESGASVGASIRQLVVAQDKNGRKVFLAVAGATSLGDNKVFLLRSIDAGRTWHTLVGPPDGVSATYVRVAADNPRMIYAFAPPTGLLRQRNLQLVVSVSDDGGETWTEKSSDPLNVALPPEYEFASVGDIEVDPVDPLSLWRVDGSVWHSNDGGTSWEQVDALPTSAFADVAVFRERGRPAIVAAFRDESPSAELSSCFDRVTGELRDCVYLSRDGGQTWSRVPVTFGVGTSSWENPSLVFAANGALIARGWTADGSSGYTTINRYEPRSDSFHIVRTETDLKAMRLTSVMGAGKAAFFVQMVDKNSRNLTFERLDNQKRVRW